jgi:UDP-N-acetylmuramate--alanine ligase
MTADPKHADSFMRRIRKVHFVGVGGAGMSGIAHVMNTLGYDVSGSDLSDTLITRKLQKEGVTVYQGHNADHVRDVDVVVISGAIRSDNR